MAEYPPTGFPYAAGASNFGPTGGMLYIFPKAAPRLLRKFYYQTSIGELTNSDYAGIVRRGGSVTVRKRATVPVNKLTAGGMAVYSNGLEADVVTMNIDRAYQWGFPIDDIQAQQADVDGWEGEWEEDAMLNSAVAVDTDFFSTIITEADATNVGNSAGAKSNNKKLGDATNPLAWDKTTAVSIVARTVTCLKENKIHGVKPWIVLPSWATEEVQQAELVQAIYTGDDKSPLRKADMEDGTESKALGRISGQTIFESELLYNSGGIWYCPFGCREAVTFANQIQKSDRLKNPFAHGDLMRGFMAYGHKTTIPTALGVIAIRQGSTLAQG